MATEIESFESPDLTPLDFCLYGWMTAEAYKRKVDAREELLALIFFFCVAAVLKKHQDQVRHTTRYLRTRAAKCTEIAVELPNIYYEL